MEKSKGRLKQWYVRAYAATIFQISVMPLSLCLSGALPGEVAAATVTQVAAGWCCGNDFTALKSDGTVWLFNSAFNTTPVQGLSGFTAVSEGVNHWLALKNDGTVWGWGDNLYGELGNTIPHFPGPGSPVQVGGLTGVTAISAGWGTTMVLKNDGTVWGLGGNGSPLGNGTTNGSDVPVQAVGLYGATQVSTKGIHTVALKNDGTVWTWGWNASGQLGDGSFIDHYVPAQVPDFLE